MFRAGNMMIRLRAFRAADADALAVWLDPLMPADEVCTARALVHQRQVLSRSSRPLWLVAAQGEEVIGFAREEARVFGSQPGQRRVWVAVRSDHRRKRVGTGLWEKALANARAAGATALRSWAIADSVAGKAFLKAKGFRVLEREKQWWTDPADVDRTELSRRRELAHSDGYEVAVLADLLPDMEDAIRRAFLGADEGAPRPGPEFRVSPATFRRFMLGNPTLDQSLCTVVLNGHKAVSLCWLKGDHQVGRYGIEFTGTLPSERGRGLATLAKMAALELASDAGVRWVGTTNSTKNGPMLAINRRLRHQGLQDLLIYERQIG